MCIPDTDYVVIDPEDFISVLQSVEKIYCEPKTPLSGDHKTLEQKVG